jgi:Bacterial capsule synthesis protein PGA_cap
LTQLIFGINVIDAVIGGSSLLTKTTSEFNLIIAVLVLNVILVLSGCSYRKLELTFAGDIMAHNINYKMHDFSQIYKGLSTILLNDDLSFVNLEFPIALEKGYESYPFFNVKPAYVEAAINGGFEVFSLANNHSLDQGISGVEGTLEVMSLLKEEYNIAFHGLKDRKTTQPGELFTQAETIKEGEINIAFASFTDSTNLREGIERLNIIPNSENLNEDYFLGLQAYLSNLRKTHDLVIVSVHGGEEYSQQPSDGKKLLFRRFIDSGADILWSHHPHVLQGYERVKLPGREGLILYSMGNLISAQPFGFDKADRNNPFLNTAKSELAKVTVQLRKGRKVKLILETVPITTYKDPLHGYVARFTADLSEDKP